MSNQTQTRKKRIKPVNVVLTLSLALNLFFATFAIGGSAALAEAAQAFKPLTQLKQTWQALTPEGQDMIRAAILKRQDKMKANAAQGREFQLAFADAIEGETVDEEALNALVASKQAFVEATRDNARAAFRAVLTDLPQADRQTIATAIRNHEPKAEKFIDTLVERLEKGAQAETDADNAE